MEITDIRIRKLDTDSKLKAYVTITFDDSFVVHNVKIIDGKNGPFIAMPSRKTRSGEYKDVAHPINSSFRGTMQDDILKEYERVLKEGGDAGSGDSMDGDDPEDG